MTIETRKVLEEIFTERQYQETKWGDSFDSKNTANDWVAYIVKYAGQSVTLPWNSDQFRTQLLKVAAICVAAVERIDRNNGVLPKRHYDT
jgi:hypothetical protein